MSVRSGHRQLPSANYLKSDAELLITKATEFSYWFDDWWDYKNATAGSRSKGINWYGYFTQTEKSDPDCKALVDQGRRLLDACRFSKNIKRRKDSTLFEPYASALRGIIRWMYINQLRSFSEFTPEQASWFVDDLIKERQDEIARKLATAETDDEVEEERGTSAAVIERYLTVLIDAYNLASEFADFPELMIEQHPLRGMSAYEAAAELGVITDGWIPPVPDEVLHPLLEVAHRWIEVYSEDILIAQDTFLAAVERLGKVMPKNTPRPIVAALKAVQFDGSGSLSAPWRPPIGQTSIRQGSVGSSSPPATNELRELIYDLRDASTTGLQAGTGIRVSEVAGLLVEGRDINGWPSCLQIRQSASGLYDLYILKGRVFKGSSEANGTEVEWILGAKPVGSNAIPFPVKAVLILDALFRPWREKFGSKALIVSLGTSRGLPVSVPKKFDILSDSIREGQNGFLHKYVTLPAHYSNWRLSTQQFRKKFAQDVVRIDDTLIPAVRDHFKHISDFVLESAYLGTDPRLMGLINDVATREAARLIVGTLFEGKPLAGKMADLIRSRKGHFEEVCSGSRSNEGRINLLTAALELDEIRFFSAEHADCFFRAHLAACHKDLLGVFDPNAKRPLNAYRTPKNCGDCPNGIKSSAHLPFWRERLSLYKRIEVSNREAGEHRLEAEAAAYVRQAERVLRQLGDP